MLSKIWFYFFFVSFFAALYQWLFLSNTEVFSQIVSSLFDSAKLSVDIAIGLVGLMCFWLGLFRLAEKANLIHYLAKGLSPLFRQLMPGVPQNHKSHGSITMNLAANMLGLDNAATPLGLKAMQDLQEVNSEKQTASNAQILFLVLNTSSVTLVPATLFMYRAQLGSNEPAAIYLPILIATTVSTLVGLGSVVLIQKINLFNRVVLLYALSFAILLSGFVFLCLKLVNEDLSQFSTLSGNLIIFSIVILFLSFAHYKKVDVYNEFIEGAKDGFQVAVSLIPYLVAMLAAIGVLRASGVLEMVLDGIAYIADLFHLNTDFIPVLPTALMKPFSGSGARAMMLDTMNNYGVDSFQGLLSGIVQGSTETTFYVLAVYFGSVGIRNVRHAIFCGLLADAAGIVAAIMVGYWFFYSG